MREQLAREKARRVRWLVLDVDGVLTDGRIVLDGGEGEWKAFDVRDGHRIVLGATYDEVKNKPKAIEMMERAIAINPQNAAARNNLGVIYDRTGSPGLAVNEFKAALELDPRLKGTKLNLAVAYGHLGRNDLHRPIIQ